MLAELRLTPAGSRISFARLVADVVPILAERFVHPGAR